MPHEPEKPVVSVIIPVYNMAGGDRLKWCLDSLVDQTIEKKRPGSLELIAVDDCSTDDSLKILKEYAGRYPSLLQVIASKENLHQGGAKNLGLSQAKGEWIGFVDADDWVAPDYYERLLDEAERTGADMAGCDYSLVCEHTWTPGERVANNSLEQTGELDHEKYRLLLLDSGSLVVKIYRREIIFGAGAFPEGMFYEDNAVVNSWMLRAKSFAYIPEPMYFYYQHDASTVHTLSMRNLRDRMEAGRLMLKAARDEGYLDEYRPEIEFLFTNLFYRNTLFSAMARYREGRHKRGADGPTVAVLKGRGSVYTFTKRLAGEMAETFPGFQENMYYKERIDDEERGFMALQMRSQALFFIKYRLLWLYRRARKRFMGSRGA